MLKPVSFWLILRLIKILLTEIRTFTILEFINVGLVGMFDYGSKDSDYEG